MPDTATPETTEIPLYSSATAAAAPVASPEVDAAPPSTPALPMSLKDAVHNCRKAYNQAFTAEKARGATDCDAKEMASEAFCNCLPLVTSEGNMRAFIACVTHAMATHVVKKGEGLKLLYAARTAFLCLPRESRPVGRPRTNLQDRPKPIHEP